MKSKEWKTVSGNSCVAALTDADDVIKKKKDQKWVTVSWQQQQCRHQVFLSCITKVASLHFLSIIDSKDIICRWRDCLLIHNKFIMSFVLLFFMFYFWCLQKWNKKCLHKLKMCSQVSELCNKLPNIFVHKNSVSQSEGSYTELPICFICWHTQECIQVHGLWNQNNRRTTTSY